LKAAALETHGVVSNPEPFVYLEEFADSAVTYCLKFWISDPQLHKKIEHHVRMNVWYRLKQKGYGIPFPMRTVEHIPMQARMRRELADAVRQRRYAIDNCGILAPLTDEEKQGLAEEAAEVMLGPEQALFHQGDPGSSFYIIRSGNADVLIKRDGVPETKVATLGPGDFFGEMSALTGEPRTATIRASGNLVCVEITKDELKEAFTKDPAMMDKMSQIIAERNTGRQKVAEIMNAQQQRDAVETQQKSLLSRMKTFFSRSLGR
jgi:CRP-like cAMP-binding protein